LAYPCSAANPLADDPAHRENGEPMASYVLDDIQALEITAMLKQLVIAIYDIGVYHLPCRLLDPDSDYRIDDLHQDVMALIERLHATQISP
jgi:hypothetical protein